MQVTDKHNERIAKMSFASVFPHYLKKVESKGRTKEELHQVIEWLTGFDQNKVPTRPTTSHTGLKFWGSSLFRSDIFVDCKLLNA